MTNSGRYGSLSTIEELLEDPAAMEILELRLPGFTSNEQLLSSKSVRLGTVLDYLGNDGVDIDGLIAELAALSGPQKPADNESWANFRDDYEDDSIGVGTAAVRVQSISPSTFRTAEIAFQGPSHGNPFLDVSFAADVTDPHGESKRWPGFYDGAGQWKVRFLPEEPGRYTLITTSNARSLHEVRVSVDVAPPSEHDHGPVRVRGWGFVHADGKRALPLGTTCYAWTHQGTQMEEATLASLAGAPWSKLRMCVFPKSMAYNENDPELYPYAWASPDATTPRTQKEALRATDSGRIYDTRTFNPEFFRHIEERISDLAELGIDADLILFHSYDRWGYAEMSAQADDHYVRYIVARLAAFPNVWWSMANEFDVMTKSEDSWHRLGRLVRELDPVGHPIGIHQMTLFFDHSADWITHASVQRVDRYRTSEETDAWRKRWGKPVVLDEICYEGDLPYAWGNITAEELVRRHWEGALRGGWPGHGETYLDPEDKLWWAKGGVLKGTSPDRIAFLREVLEDAAGDLEPADGYDLVLAKVGEDYFLAYWSFMQPRKGHLRLPTGEWELDILDTWNMTVSPLEGLFRGDVAVTLPGKQYIAVRGRRRGN